MKRDAKIDILAGCMVMRLAIAIRAAVLVGTIWLGVWALRQFGVIR